MRIPKQKKEELSSGMPNNKERGRGPSKTPKKGKKPETSKRGAASKQAKRGRSTSRYNPRTAKKPSTSRGTKAPITRQKKGSFKPTDQKSLISRGKGVSTTRSRAGKSVGRKREDSELIEVFADAFMNEPKTHLPFINDKESILDHFDLSEELPFSQPNRYHSDDNDSSSDSSFSPETETVNLKASPSGFLLIREKDI